MKETRKEMREVEVEVEVCDICKRDVDEYDTLLACIVCERDVCAKCRKYAQHIDVLDDEDGVVCSRCLSVLQQYCKRLRVAHRRVDEIDAEWRAKAEAKRYDD